MNSFCAAGNLDVRSEINLSKDLEGITTNFKFKQRLENEGQKYGMYYERDPK